ncbi:MAG: hypothetical protein KIS79_07825 [Burkholderiales bacterium]|nr:hypothetical protein [Burkholderiales bacterium]
MVDPISLAAIAWPLAEGLRSSALAGVIGNVADRQLGEFFSSVRNRFAGISGPAENHDIAKALRLAQFQALEHVIRDFRDVWQIPHRKNTEEDFGIFFDKAGGFCRKNLGRCMDLKIKLNLEINNDLLAGIESTLGEVPSAPSEPRSQSSDLARNSTRVRRDRVRELAQEAVLSELVSAIDPVIVPEPFIAHFRAGNSEHQPWIELYGAYVVQQIKENDRFRNIYVAELLLQVKGLQIDQAEVLALMDARFGTLVESIQRIEAGQEELQHGQVRLIAGQEQLMHMVSEVLQRMGTPAADDASVREEFERLKTRLAATEGDLIGLLRSILQQPNVPAEKISEALAQAHKVLLVAREEITTLRAKSADYPELSEYLARAAAALDSRYQVDLEQAQQALAEARSRFREAVRRHRLRDAETEHVLLLREAQLAHARLRYEEAARLYREAAAVLLPEQERLRAVALVQAGEAQSDHAEIFGGVEPLTQALADYAQALILYPRETAPADWAAIQNDRANVLQSLGNRLGGMQGLAALREAIVGYEAALEVRTRQCMPMEWAATQNNRALALLSLGDRLGGEESLNTLRQAIACCEEALEVRTQQSMPADWAATQHNRASVLQSLGDRLSREESLDMLRRAIAGYDDALEVRRRESTPVDWAKTQNGRANALQSLSNRLGGDDGSSALRQAITGYEAALEIFTRESTPLDWAKTQHNRANAMQSLGDRLSGEDSLDTFRQALAGYQAALEIFIRESAPANWAMIQHNRANALQCLGDRLDGEEGVSTFRQALAAYEAALEIITHESMPADWAMIQHNRANALLSLDDRVRGEEGLDMLHEAIAGYEAALEVRTWQSMPYYHEQTRTSLERARCKLRDRGG